MIRKIQVALLFCCLVGAVNANTAELNVAIENLRSACVGISDELNRMKTMAGINTAVTAVGTVAAGGGLGAGIAKSGVDSEAEKLASEIADDLEELRMAAVGQDSSKFEYIDVTAPDVTDFWEVQDDAQDAQDAQVVTNADIEAKKAELERLNKKSVVLGNVRTGTLAAATATNVAGAAIAGTNRIDGDLKVWVDSCLGAVKELSNALGQARVSLGSINPDVQRAENIYRACEEWSMVDVTSINKKSTGATVSSGIGAGLGLAGTITSAVANSGGVRANDTDAGKAKEKNLNTAANVLAGGTTVASGVALVFNATQIKTLKRASEISDKCQEALQ